MRNDNIRKLSLREIQLVELDLLQALHDVCERYGLRYFLCGGTLIGAARHQGFIPWDDDIDVMMPRCDFEKLLRLCRNNLPGYSHIEPDPNWLDGLLRLQDTRTITRQVALPFSGLQERGVFIDIFSVDGMSSHKAIRYLQNLFVRCLRKISVIPMTSITSLRGRSVSQQVLLLLLLITKPLLSVFPRIWLMRLPHWAAALYPYATAQYRGVTITGFGECEVMPAEIFDRQYLMEFEGQHFHVPIGWRTYLQQRYGDWETLPPPSERIAHGMEACWKGVQPHPSPDKTA